MHVCILTISQKDDPQLWQQVISTCDFCVNKDKTFSYVIQPEGEGIKIFCPLGRDQAYRRGMYFHKKFEGIHFEVVWIRDKI
jgi:hypothetical protein